MDNVHPSRATMRTIGLAALAMLVAVVAGLSAANWLGSANAAEPSSGPAPSFQPVQETPNGQQAPEGSGEDGRRDGRDCPKDRDRDGGRGDGSGGSQRQGSTAAPSAEV